MAAPASLRLLLRFAALGGLLFAGRRLLSGEEVELRPVTVSVPNGASPAEVTAATDEAILVDLAVRAGLARSDAVVRARLLSALEAAGERAPASEAIELALALRLHETDAIARRRLSDLARRNLLAAAPEPDVTSADLEAELAAHPDRYRLPARVQLEQLFFSNARGPQRDADARAARAALASAASSAASLPPADPWPWASGAGATNTDRLDALHGEGFGARVAELPVGAWSEPIGSAFGVHLVRVTAREPGRLMSLAEATPRARAAVREQRRARDLDARLAELRPRYRAELEASP